MYVVWLGLTLNLYPFPSNVSGNLPDRPPPPRLLALSRVAAGAAIKSDLHPGEREKGKKGGG